MQMTNKEIAARYGKMDGSVLKRISILAELNGCDRSDIDTVLRAEGILPKKPGRPKKENETEKPKKQEKIATREKKAPELPHPILILLERRMEALREICDQAEATKNEALKEFGEIKEWCTSQGIRI